MAHLKGCFLLGALPTNVLLKLVYPGREVAHVVDFLAEVRLQQRVVIFSGGSQQPSKASFCGAKLYHPFSGALVLVTLLDVFLGVVDLKDELGVLSFQKLNKRCLLGVTRQNNYTLGGHVLQVAGTSDVVTSQALEHVFFRFLVDRRLPKSLSNFEVFLNCLYASNTLSPRFRTNAPRRNARVEYLAVNSLYVVHLACEVSFHGYQFIEFCLARVVNFRFFVFLLAALL